MDQPIREERFAQARAEIARRIERFCQTLPQAEFDELVDRMAALQCKYDIFPNIPELAANPEPPDCPNLDAFIFDQIRTLEKPIQMG